MKTRVSMNRQGIKRPASNGVLERELKEWRKLYQEVFGLALSVEKIKIPKALQGFDRMIVVAQGLTPDAVYAACAARFPCVRHYTKLDADVVKNERASDLTYAFLVRGEREPDRELADMSADDLSKNKISAATLLEYLLCQLACFIETGNLLDEKNITLCAGSRYTDGRVPTAMSHRGELKIHWCAPHEKNLRLRAREVQV